MARLRSHKTSFTAGEVSPRLLGRGDLSAYENGAATLRNVFVHPTGGLTRRPGLGYVDTARGAGRLIAFEFNTEQVYLLVLTDGWIDIYKGGALVASVAAPWSLAQLSQINWTQSADTLLVVHPDAAPRKITRTSDSAWTIVEWAFHSEGGIVYQPYHKFADPGVTVTPSATTGAITVTASAPVFDAAQVGDRMRIGGNEIAITGHTSATQISATVKQTLASTTATEDWEEAVFSDYRGRPVSVCFHQDRLVVGGSRDLPNRLWMSKSADLFNFDLGSGLDDEAIDFPILSDQVNAIRAAFSGRHLQVFTSGAEWMVTGSPLTPSAVQLHRQTRLGSPIDRTVPPRDVDGATLFVPRTGQALREFLFADVEQAYQANDLAMLSEHLINKPLDQDYDQLNRVFLLVMSDGNLGSVTVYRNERVTAWTLQETQGSFLSVAVVGEDTYVLVNRATGVFIEVFDTTLNTDSALIGTASPAKATWSGLDHLEGQTVKVVADGAVAADETVSGGAVTLAATALTVEAGLGFSHIIETLPPAVMGAQQSSQGGKVRPIAITLRLKDTPALRIDVGRGFVNIPFRRFGAGVLDAPPTPFSGDKTIRAFGWRRDGTRPLWRIEQDLPLPFILLSAVTEFAVND